MEAYPKSYRVCDSCYQAYIDETDDTDIESAVDFMAEMGADVADHECDTWLYGGQPCLCACHPQ